jgi:hypothetical protein
VTKVSVYETADKGKKPAGLVAAIIKWEDGLTREALWEALWNRRTYATSGERILVDFRINGELPGGTIKVSGLPKVEITVAGREEIETIELIRNSKVVARIESPGRIFSTSFSDRDFQCSSYYYVRISQKSVVENNGIEKALTSPIRVVPE